jgi:hypothetical protein
MPPIPAYRGNYALPDFKGQTVKLGKIQFLKILRRLNARQKGFILLHKNRYTPF